MESMKKIMLVLLAMAMLSGCASKAYWRPNTSYNEAREDVVKCHQKAYDASKAGDISWEKDGKSYRHKCMEEKGYVLRAKKEAYPELYSAPLGKQ
jgi:outer membrane biogenesis lipoprotein LolB